MDGVHYEVNLDSLKEAAPSPALYESVYDSSDFYVNTSALSTAQQHLPEITIGGVAWSSDEAQQTERFNALIKELLSQKSDGNRAMGSSNNGNMEFAANADGTYSHKVERGDTYWKVARGVVMAQMKTDNPSEVKDADVAKMMDQLIAFNGETRESANKISVGEEIQIPKEFGEKLEQQHESTDSEETSESAAASGSGEVKQLSEKEKKELPRTLNGIKLAEVSLNPVDGVYNPLQPPGFEPSKTGDYDMNGFWNYDVEGRTTDSDVINKQTGMRTLTYSAQVDSGYGANMTWWNDTPFTATENINAAGVMTYRHIDYQDSSVGMNFADANGNKVDAYVTSVESELNPTTGNYNSRITTVDGKTYYMQVDQSGHVIKKSISEDSAF